MQDWHNGGRQSNCKDVYGDNIVTDLNLKYYLTPTVNAGSIIGWYKDHDDDGSISPHSTYGIWVRYWDYEQDLFT